MTFDGSTPLHIAILRGQTVIAELLIEHGADPNMGDSNDCSPLLMLLNTRKCLHIPTDDSPNVKKVCTCIIYIYIHSGI